MNSATRIKLSVMMFLQYAIWSVWALMLVPHLAELKMSEVSIGLIMACGGLGSILGPFIVGQLADRYFATEKVLAVCHLARGPALDRRVVLHHLLADLPADAGLLQPLLPHGRTDQLADLPGPGRGARQPVRADPPLGHDRLASGHIPGGSLSQSEQRSGPVSQALLRPGRRTRQDGGACAFPV